MRVPKILIACEYSGVVREAFATLYPDFYVTSCDILETEQLCSPNASHYTGDIFDILYDGWDMLIGHPPCTYLSSAGARWFNVERYGDKAVARHQNRLKAIDFVNKLWESGIPRICIENPVGFLNTHWRKPSQIVQPYHFGDAESKRTCLWLRNLPPLSATKIVKPKVYGWHKTGRKKGRPIYLTVHFSKSPRIAQERSRFFTGFANAMARQWGIVVLGD